jgi:uncharacterized membrane protein SpoIIM required for sporulation
VTTTSKPPDTEAALKSTQFRREREKSWQELEKLLELGRRRGLGRLKEEDLARLPTLYRSAVSSLSVARAISLDRALLDYLEGLVARAYLLTYSNPRFLFQVVVDFFLRRFPLAGYRVRRQLLLSAAVVALGFFAAYFLTVNDLERYHSFVPDQVAGGRTPASTPESLRAALYDDPKAVDGLTYFAAMLFVNNASVGIMSFALGFVAGVPCAILLFFNGLILGSMTALYSVRGMKWDFAAWVAGHGVTELLAICLCGAGGFALAGAMLFPGRRTRVAQLAVKGRECAPLVVGAVIMLFFAALIESYVRQLLPDMRLRWGVAAATAAFWAWYFFFVGGRADRLDRAKPAAAAS